ncbi:fumarylacetoacetate hydrolase family protein [Sporosarcina sp. FA9]|uniref:fumarylacetoacetate hydrolase family protein n=1 Tax=Sporosarcina sp. FA9 TaxID=3413030 RepID=UPI003F65B6ED
MKFVTFKKDDNKARLGIYKNNEEIIDLTLIDPAQPLFNDMLSFIEGGSEAVSMMNDILQTMDDESFISKMDEVTILPPIPRPNRNIYCVGLNYAEHNEEFSGQGSDVPADPIIFSKAPSSVIGTEDSIEAHSDITQELDYEAELAIIIGVGGRDIPEDRALDYVFGYTIINDVTARDLQRKHQQWLLGKSLDTTCPMGPSVIHHSAIDPANLNISCRVNGETRQSSNTKHMIFDIPTIISTISKGHTLAPGDIIATGTCAGVGMGFNPPKFLKKGDLVEVEIENIGVLRNYVN